MAPRIVCASLLALSSLAACASAPAPAPKVAPAPVHVTIAVAADAFAADSEIRVAVWNEAQLALRAHAGECVVSFDGKTQTTICPPGVTYTPATPEEFTFKAADLAHPLRFEAASIKPGERYEISIGGRASDQCNHTGGSTRGVVAGDTIAIANLALATTDMACIQGS
ncbi:MAG: hypothetical protein K8W52_01520 [Deltaproteobacteria bacterium]|nr:hypothetical protein [Deltaproteobacteria bacterium]